MLDEATASCDVTTDAMVQRVIRRVFEGCTVLTVAHVGHCWILHCTLANINSYRPVLNVFFAVRGAPQRIHTIADSDRIMVLSKGNIAEFGEPSVLLQTPGSMYRSLVTESNSGHSGSSPRPNSN
jgi:ABC-type transport system involved in cytochrome bd biosynthesis fused ATPase/permease subunit